MSLFLLSFAGIPLTSGFIAKLDVFSAASAAGMGPLVVVAMIATAITAFFYLRIVVLMYFSAPASGFNAAGLETNEPFVVLAGPLTAIVIGVSVLVTVVLGIFPQPFLNALEMPWPLLS